MGAGQLMCSTDEGERDDMDYSANCSTLFTRWPVWDRPGIAADAGFDAVEFWWPFPDAVPDDAEVSRFEEAIGNAGVRLTGLNLFAGDMAAGDRGVLSSPSREREFQENVAVVAEIGARLGCRLFNALYGAREDGESPQHQDEVALANLALAAERVAGIGGTILVEPVSGVPGYPVKTAEDALAVVGRVREQTGRGNVRLLADFYHLAVNGEDVAAVVERHAPVFGHVQIADSPGRGAPGTGELPLQEWVRRSRELGYAGRVGLEYLDPAGTDHGWRAEWDRDGQQKEKDE